MRSIKTQYGYVSGIASDTEGVTLFKGIPIGADTAGENRFKAPQLCKAWEGVRVCDTWPDRFLQESAGRDPGTFWGDEFYYDSSWQTPSTENGLAVNIYMPENADETSKLPVFVYIHGGGFTGGYGSEVEFNAAHLAAQDVVVVLIQYRLSALGWLALPELSEESGHGASGNQTVLDQVFALEWVRDNIASFGGDAGKVTIAGQSAGAMSVTNLLKTPLAKGLFRGAIVQSGFNGFVNVAGGLGAEFVPLKEAEAKGQAAVEMIFGKGTTLKDLRAVSTEEWLEVRAGAPMGMMGTPACRLAELTQATYNMVLDGYVFTEDSIDLTKSGNLDDVQIMIGGCSDEMTTLIGDFIKFMGVTPDNIDGKMAEEYAPGCAALYDTATPDAAENSYMRAGSDFCLQKYLVSAEMTKNNKNHQTYAYYFHQTPPGRDSGFRGSYHSSDLWYMFDSIREGAAGRPWTEDDYRVAKIMSTCWMNFVKYLDPNGNPEAEADPAGIAGTGVTLDWQPCSAENEYAFVEFSAGSAKAVTATEYPERDQFFRKLVYDRLK